MNEKQDDGGPAFPAPSVYGDENTGHMVLERGELGMTLRDYFAGQAIAGLLAARWETGSPGVTEPVMFDGGLNRPADDVAQAAYTLADAMLAARG